MFDDAIGEEREEDMAVVEVVVKEVGKDEVTEEEVCVWMECDEVS